MTFDPGLQTATPTLSLFQSLWAMEDLPYRGESQWTLAERVDMIAGGGFAGLAVDLGARQAPAAADVGPLAAAAGLRTAVFAFVRDATGLDSALRYAEQIGAPDMVVCAEVFDPDPLAQARIINQWYGIAERAGVRLQLETHRGTMTNDLRMTTRILANLDPAVDLAIDLSHHVCGCELPDKATDEIENLISLLLARAGSLQGRIANRGQVQLPLTFPAHQGWVERFRGWWVQGFRTILDREPQADIMFCTELGTTPYAITGADGLELSDRWAEALLLCDWAATAFADAMTMSDGAAPTDPTPATAQTAQPARSS
ncbi:hypothetical protein ABIB25_003894 [Nakamurella sp. UYEF19]|uniref:sugar phosphate isomerase/epimerase family protein n=1 Tax=Nakamurella sp. UYEF19 TaxID=1756392 RepID=UPI003398BA51